MSVSRDWISSLPDEILGKILSLVPTKLAASTSVLSKRWRNLLGLDDSVVVYQNEEEEKSGAERFLGFLVNTLLSSNSPTKIKKFALRHRGRVALENDFSRLVYRWIWNAMKQGGLLELHLECSRDQFDIERVLLTSNTLVKLTLSGNYSFGEEVEGLFFPALKSLSVLSVLGLDFEDYCRLVDGCPVLEELFITDDGGGGDGHYPYVPCWSTSVESASIRRLVVSVDLPYDDSSKEDYYETYFKAPSLVYLDYSSVVFEDYKVDDLVSLVEVKLDLRLWKSKKMFGDVTKLVAGISNITTLHLSPDSLEVFHFCCKSMPVNNLLSLSIESSKEKGWQVMPLLLNSCPNLQTLALKGLLHRVTNRCGNACACIPNKKREKRRKTVKECCLWTCQVKVLEVSEYGGSLRELKQMRHFLGNLKCLETVRVVGVYADNNNSNNNKKKSKFLRANLLALPILSSKCNSIHFI